MNKQKHKFKIRKLFSISRFSLQYTSICTRYIHISYWMNDDSCQITTTTKLMRFGNLFPLDPFSLTRNLVSKRRRLKRRITRHISGLDARRALYVLHNTLRKRIRPVREMSRRKIRNVLSAKGPVRKIISLLQKVLFAKCLVKKHCPF